MDTQLVPYVFLGAFSLFDPGDGGGTFLQNIGELVPDQAP
jgi:hypothetical protein